MLAVVEIAGKQFKVSESMKVEVPKLNVEVGEKVTLNKVLLVQSDASKLVGNPYIKDGSIVATVLSHGREDKILVFRKKKRKNFKVRNGHRQEYTTIQIDSIKS